MTDEEDFDETMEDLRNHRLTPAANRQVVGIVSAFNHGHNIDTIADIENLEVEEVRMLMLMLCIQAGIV